jgi:hypothetical protein
MGNQPKDVRVTVTLKPGQVPDYTLQSQLLQGGKLTFRNNGFPGFNVYFDLVDPDNSGYVWPDDANMALAATPLAGEGTECPDQGTKWGQFNPVAVIKDKDGRNTTLKVRNPNAPGQSCDFGYSLFVTQQPDGSGSYWKLDPIGSNQNGPQADSAGDGFLARSWIGTAVIGLAVIAVVAVALYEFGVFGR